MFGRIMKWRMIAAKTCVKILYNMQIEKDIVTKNIVRESKQQLR